MQSNVNYRDKIFCLFEVSKNILFIINFRRSADSHFKQPMALEFLIAFFDQF